MQSFLFISPEITLFEETDGGARILATVMELEKVSRNGRFYRIEEAKSIAKSLEGKPVYYGIDWAGRHENPLMRPNSKSDPVGFVESAKVVGNKIKAIIKVISQGLIESLKQGVKYLFSVGGHAISEVKRKIGNRIVNVLKGARCNHLQIVDVGTPVGFPNAKMEKILEINETVMMCKDGVCEFCPPTKQSEEIIEIYGGEFLVGIEYED